MDSNYDPSESFFPSLPIRKDEGVSKIQDDLAVSESDEEEPKDLLKPEEQQQPPPTADEELCDGSVWF